MNTLSVPVRKGHGQCGIELCVRPIHRDVRCRGGAEYSPRVACLLDDESRWTRLGIEDPVLREPTAYEKRERLDLRFY